MLAGLVVFIIYEVEMQWEGGGAKTRALLMYFITVNIILSLMLLATAAGCASVGQVVISYFAVVAEVATGTTGPPQRPQPL